MMPALTKRRNHAPAPCPVATSFNSVRVMPLAPFLPRSRRISFHTSLILYSPLVFALAGAAFFAATGAAFFAGAGAGLFAAAGAAFFAAAGTAFLTGAGAGF